MSDLDDTEMDEWVRSLDRMSPANLGGWHKMTLSAIVEIQRRRAEQAAGREHVERVVRETTERYMIEVRGGNLSTWSSEIARRVADRLSVPVLSEDRCDHMRTEIDRVSGLCEDRVWGEDSLRSRNSKLMASVPILLDWLTELLDRLIPAGKP